ncbi:MAG: hypothetical protein IJO32_07365 [Bacilli bacterium]|nr:hypothetical protein [Bacilli bacterium]
MYYLNGTPYDTTKEPLKSKLDKLVIDVLKYTNLFSKKTKNIVINNFTKKVGTNFCSNYKGPSETALSDVTEESFESDGIHVNFNLSDSVSNFVKKHEFWHAFMYPEDLSKLHTYKYFVSGHGCQMYEIDTFNMFKETGVRGDLLGCGGPIEEGMANVIACLSTIKDNALESNDLSILKEADDYMLTGNVGKSLANVFRGYYIPLEDIVRLLILASRNDYMLEHKFSKVLASNEGLDGIIGTPINKPYCSFINSSIYGDFEFQKEFDNNIKLYNDKNNTNFLSYDDICGWLYRTQFESIKDHNTISDLEGWKEIIISI